jgi:phenylacetate-CoA ligase
MMDREFFNEEIETMPKDQLREMQLERLKCVVSHAYYTSQFYRQAYDAHGVHPTDVEYLGDVRKLPLLDKDTVHEAYPYGLAVTPRENLREVHCTSHAGGKPVPVFATQEDLNYWSELNARGMWAIGLRPGDVLLNSHEYGLRARGLGFHNGAHAMDVMVIPAGTHDIDRQIDLILDFGVTAICATPSLAVKIGERAHERGKDVSLEAHDLRIGLFGGEPWASGVRSRVEDLFGITAYDEFGMTELLGPGTACECTERDGLHTWADAFFVECVDPLTGEWVAEGELGELVWTWLSGDGTAVIRYRSGDLSSVTWHESCPCGRTHPKIARIKGRVGDAITLEGRMVFPSQIEDALSAFKEVNSRFRISVEQVNGRQMPMLRVELREACMLMWDGLGPRLCSEIADGVHSAAGIRPEVRLVAPDSL